MKPGTFLEKKNVNTTVDNKQLYSWKHNWNKNNIKYLARRKRPDTTNELYAIKAIKTRKVTGLDKLPNTMLKLLEDDQI